MKKKFNGVGVGMPAYLYLQEFGSQIWSVFGSCPYIVGSCLYKKVWRDVDIRMILDDDDFEIWGFGKPASENGKRTALEMAFAELGKRMTGLPIDFQIQQQTWANEKYQGPRSAIGIVALRMKPSEPEQDPKLLKALESFRKARQKQLDAMPKRGLIPKK